MRADNAATGETKESSAYRKIYISRMEKWLIKKLLDVLGKPQIYIALPDDTIISSYNRIPATGMHILDRKAMWRFIAKPGLSFGEGFRVVAGK